MFESHVGFLKTKFVYIPLKKTKMFVLYFGKFKKQFARLIGIREDNKGANMEFVTFFLEICHVLIDNTLPLSHVHVIMINFCTLTGAYSEFSVGEDANPLGRDVNTLSCKILHEIGKILVRRSGSPFKIRQGLLRSAMLHLEGGIQWIFYSGVRRVYENLSQLSQDCATVFI